MRYSLVAPSSRVVDSVLQSSLRMRERLCTTPELHAFADVVSTFFAPIAVLARLSNFQCNLISDLEI
jgi:hypothetical protein